MIEIVAEAGINHNGSIETAFKLVDAAKIAGCDVFKTQLFDTERVYPPERWPEMKMLELERDEIVRLKDYTELSGLEFLCTPDEIEDAEFLKSIGVKRIKTSSQDVTNIKFLQQVSDLGIPMILSTGACSSREMDRAIFATMGVRYKTDLTVLHCVSCYPAPPEQMNLTVIDRIARSGSILARRGLRVGLSDHTRGYDAALIALGKGAVMFEKHLTLDTSQAGPDHHASLDPSEMLEYVRTIRRGELMLGDGIKRVMPCEEHNRQRFEEFIAARK